MVYVAQKVASFYETESPGFPVNVNVSSAIQGLPVGSGSVWQHLGPASVADKRSLLERFGSASQEVPIGIEGVLVILNKQNPLSDLSLEQLRAIFTGKISNWKEVGGPDRRIQLYSTESLVGGSMYFQDSILQGADIDTTMRGYSNPRETAIAVASDLGGIGLSPIAGEDNVKYPRIRRSPDTPGIDGTSENVRNLVYPLSSYLYWSFGRQYSAAVEHFIEFTLSGRGQMAIEASGCYPLSANQRVRSQIALEKK